VVCLQFTYRSGGWLYICAGVVKPIAVTAM